MDLDTNTTTETRPAADPGEMPALSQGDEQRDQGTGYFAPGNTVAKTHGLHAWQTRGEAPAVLVDQVDRFRQGLTADQGGEADLTTIRAGYVRRLAEVEGCVLLLAADLQARGLFTPRGRVRSTYDRLLKTIEVWDRLAQRLGMDRRQRAVPDLNDYLAERTDGRR